MEEDFKKLQTEVQMLRNQLDLLLHGDRYRFTKDIDLNDASCIRVSGVYGSKIGCNATDKIGFFGATPVTQQGSPVGKQDTSGSSGVNMTTGHGFNGNTGSTYYTVGDIVYALKTLGFLA